MIILSRITVLEILRYEYMYVQREKFINKYLKFSAFVVPISFGTYPSMHFESMAKRLCWIFIGIIGATILLVPLMWI